MARQKVDHTLNAVELYYSKYDPNLGQKEVQEMVDFRKNEDPGFDPMSKNWWSLGPSGCNYALISMCIKEDLQQTAGELALRLVNEKQIPYASAAYVVAWLRQNGKLYYFDSDKCIHLWKPKVVIKARRYA